MKCGTYNNISTHQNVKLARSEPTTIQRRGGNTMWPTVSYSGTIQTDHQQTGVNGSTPMFELKSTARKEYGTAISADNGTDTEDAVQSVGVQGNGTNG
ncbi:putative nonstructural protein NS-3 [Myzus persicae densovirus 1]|uniref:Putative nonstructural protein NS-3 n=1 Tax=Myzus persicae densovirus 1 TaxID=2847998 RepID=Q8B4Q1_9VIRU|nr:putative nonstructural protein NS-3 [Myzus persicae densovirus 1]AAN41663.1 putative nonstructural protein NS-3 [Myzus persicae densovirus 1]